jgi:outer membrane protein TolC
VQKRLADPAGGLSTPVIPAPSGVRPIRLPDALALAGVENPVILLAEQAVQSSLALQLRARVLLLPNLNAGWDYDNHTGPLQTSYGAIRTVNRYSTYLGLGARAVAAETVAIPGVWLFANLANAWYEPLVAGRVVTQRQFEAVATRNDVLLDVAVRYLRLLGAEGRLAVVRQTQADFAEVVRLTVAFAEVQLGRVADAERARTNALLLESNERRAQEEVVVASADLSRLLNLDPSIRLQIANDPILVVQLIDPKKTLPELIQVALRNRPEVRAVAAEIAAAQARVKQEKARPFLPTVSVGYSEGGFGGGSQFTTPTFFKLQPRADVDAIAWWTFQNMGFGNCALVKQRRAELGEAEGRRGVLVNRIDREVADAYNLSAARFRGVQVAERQVQTAVDGLQRDLGRIRGGVGLPIELLNSADLLYQTRLELLRAILAFDEAQFQLFVALGQPPTLAMADEDGGH